MLGRAVVAFVVTLPLSVAGEGLENYPIIDVHLHSRSLAALQGQGPNPVTGATPINSVEQHIEQTLAMMDRYHVVLGIVSGGSRDLRILEGPMQFKERAPDRIWASASFG